MPRSPREPHGLGAEGDVPRREPVRLEDDDVVVRLTPGERARDDFVELVHLEPVENAGLHRLDEIARLELRLHEPVTAHEARPREHRVVQLAARDDVGSRRHDQRPRAKPFAAKHRVRELVIVATTSASRGIAVALARLGAVRSQNAARLSGVRQNATTRSIVGTAARMHATCVSAW